MSAKQVLTGGFSPLIDWRRMFFDGSMLVLAGLMVVTGAAVYFLKGPEVFLESLWADSALILTFTPKMLLAFGVAALVTALVPRKLIAQWLGDKAGFKGVSLATGIGAVTPGGPMISFPLVAALSKAGSSRSSLIAYLTSWEILGFQRIMIWELPLLGIEYASLRFLASLPLPFLAAFISLYLPATNDTEEDAISALQDKGEDGTRDTGESTASNSNGGDKPP